MLLVGKIVPKAEFAMTKGHCCIQLGVWGSVNPPVGPGQSPCGVQGQRPRKHRGFGILQYQEQAEKSLVLCIFLCIALCSLNTGLNSERQLILV